MDHAGWRPAAPRMCERGRVRGARRAWIFAAVAVALSAPAMLACTPDPAPSPGSTGASTTDWPDQPPADTAAHGIVVTPSGVVAPRLGGNDHGSWVRTPCFAIAWVDGGARFDHADVVLDPGHGGPELGAVGPNGLAEKEPNLAVSRQVAHHLTADGRTVVLTHLDSSYYLTIRTRTEIARALQPEIFVSIHHNSGGPAPRQGPPGTEVYHQATNAASRRLADLIDGGVVDAFGRYDIAWSSDDTQPGSRFRVDENGDYYGVLRYAPELPAVIVESAFISNPVEADLLATDEFRGVEADGITRGIRAYLEDPVRQIGAHDAAPVAFPVGPPPDAEGCVDPPLA